MQRCVNLNQSDTSRQELSLFKRVFGCKNRHRYSRDLHIWWPREKKATDVSWNIFSLHLTTYTDRDHEVADAPWLPHVENELLSIFCSDIRSCIARRHTESVLFLLRPNDSHVFFSFMHWLRKSCGIVQSNPLPQIEAALRWWMKQTLQVKSQQEPREVKPKNRAEDGTVPWAKVTE